MQQSARAQHDGSRLRAGPAAPPAFGFSAEQSAAWVYYGAQRGRAVDRQVAFVPADGALPPQLWLSLRESWQLAGGTYVFLGLAAVEDGALRAKVLALRADPAWRDASVLWVPDPNRDWRDWDAVALHLGARSASGGVIVRTTVVPLHDYAVRIPQGWNLALDDSAFRLTPPAGPAPADDAGDGREWTAAAYRVEADDRGRLRFAWTLDAAAAERFDVGLRYLTAQAALPDAVSLRFPVFALGSQKAGLEAAVDPLAPVAPDRTFFRFTAGAPVLPSHFASVMGQPLGLEPREDAGLVFAFRSRADGALYLAPGGRFAVRPVEGAKPPSDVRCGLSGAESVAFSDPSCGLEFFGGQDAAWLAADGGLVDAATTAWIGVYSTQARVDYFAQPETGALFTPGGGGLLRYLPVAAARWAETPALPMVPYGGVAGNLSLRRSLEQAVLAPRRRALAGLEGPERLAMGAGAGWAITPQGLRASFSGSGDWTRLTLARLGSDEVALRAIEGPLRAALLDNQRFMVISDPKVAAAHLDPASRLQIEGWTITFDPAEWSRHGTVLVVKQCARSLAELVDDVAAWAQADALNVAPAATQASLRRFIADARRLWQPTDGTAPDPDFRYFVETVVDNPAWNGVLFLRAAVPAANLPPALAPFLATIDGARLQLHHLAIAQAPPLDGEATDSAVFGLIRYVDPMADPDSLAWLPAAYQVLVLQVCFANSLVERFGSRVALTLNRLFDATATQRRSATGNTMILHGAYQERAGAPAYVFHQDVPTTFDLASSALASVGLERAELTVAPATTGDQVVLRFDFWGALQFVALPVLDLLSFDRLAGSGMALELSFPRAQPASQKAKFDMAATQFDPAASVARHGSLAAHFPLAPRGLLSAAMAARPADAGYMTVGTPALASTGLSAAWYGLVFELQLGTVGALAASAGLTASLLVAWSAGNLQAVNVGLKLPGSSGSGKSIGLQGVLALTFYSLQLVRGGDGGYVLLLNGIQLAFMKKTLPPNGSFDFYLFGDPDAAAGSSALGWYGAYSRKAEDKKPRKAFPALPQPPRKKAMNRRTLSPPSPASDGHVVRIPFPPDHRQRITPTTAAPWCAMGQLLMSFGNHGIYSGTASLIAPNVVVTAAHNLYAADLGGWATQVSFIPARDANVEPYGRSLGLRMSVPDEYIQLSPPNPNTNNGAVVDYTQYLYDYGIVVLQNALWNVPSLLHLNPASDEQLNNVPAWVSGYPGDKTAGTLWEAQGAQELSEELLFYRTATYNGQSGGPVTVTLGQPATRQVVGIHVAGSAQLGANFAVRITEDVLNQINGWMEE